MKEKYHEGRSIQASTLQMKKTSFVKPVYHILQMKEDDTFNWKRIEV